MKPRARVSSTLKGCSTVTYSGRVPSGQALAVPATPANAVDGPPGFDPSRFSGYAALFNEVDLGGDVIRCGAFKRTLETKSLPFPLLAEHRSALVIGSITSIAEDEIGLRVVGEVTCPRFSRQLTADGGCGLSFGFRARDAVLRSNFRELFEIDLVEVSLVNRPMQPRALAIADTHPKGEDTTKIGASSLMSGGGSRSEIAQLLGPSGVGQTT